MKGFTLIELIIVIAIVGIISGIIGFILLASIDAWTLAVNRNDIVSDGRIAMDRMVREIREVKNAATVVTADSNQFRFTNADNIDITYSLSSTNLNRAQDGQTNVLAENVSGLAFTYYDANGAVIPGPAVSPLDTDIKRVQINLTFTKNSHAMYLQSGVSLRNL